MFIHIIFARLSSSSFCLYTRVHINVTVLLKLSPRDPFSGHYIRETAVLIRIMHICEVSSICHCIINFRLIKATTEYGFRSDSSHVANFPRKIVHRLCPEPRILTKSLKDQSCLSCLKTGIYCIFKELQQIYQHFLVKYNSHLVFIC